MLQQGKSVGVLRNRAWRVCVMYPHFQLHNVMLQCNTVAVCNGVAVQRCSWCNALLHHTLTVVAWVGDVMRVRAETVVKDNFGQEWQRKYS
jgi:hypothetical protein